MQRDLFLAERDPHPDLLRTGIYSVGGASRLIGVSEHKVRTWVGGSGSVIQNDLGWAEDDHGRRRLAFSFANLMELRFVAFFDVAGVSTRGIRSVMDEMRTLVQCRHPFATKVIFDGNVSKIMTGIARKHGVTDLIAFGSLMDGVEYDPKGDARAWFPRRLMAPNVIVHPKLAFGRPVLRGSWIPTGAIADAMRAEGDVGMVAELFEISESRVEEAVAFEAELRKRLAF